MKKTLLLLITLCTTSIFSGTPSISPEFYHGTLLVGENKYHGSLGFEIGGGIRIAKRHFVSYDIGVSRQFGGVTCNCNPPKDWVTASGFNYMFMPISVRDIFGWEFGIRNGLNRNEYNETDGYFGLTSRITIGGKRVKFYYTGTASMSMIIDLFGGWPENTVYVYNMSSGVTVSLFSKE